MNFNIRRFSDKKMGDLLRFDTCIYTNKRSKTLTQHNCFDNVLHILLKQNMDKAAIKAVKFRFLLELYQTWSSSKREGRFPQIRSQTVKVLRDKVKCKCAFLKNTYLFQMKTILVISI